MNDTDGPTETDERIRENQQPAPAPAIHPAHDDRSPLDVGFPEPEIKPIEHGKSITTGG